MRKSTGRSFAGSMVPAPRSGHFSGEGRGRALGLNNASWSGQLEQRANQSGKRRDDEQDNDVVPALPRGRIVRSGGLTEPSLHLASWRQACIRQGSARRRSIRTCDLMRWCVQACLCRGFSAAGIGSKRSQFTTRSHSAVTETWARPCTTMTQHGGKESRRDDPRGDGRQHVLPIDVAPAVARRRRI